MTPRRLTPPLLALLVACDNTVRFPGDDKEPGETGITLGDDTGDDTADDTGADGWDDEAPVNTWPWASVGAGALVPAGGLADVMVRDLAADGDAVALSDGEAAWLSDDGGRSWRRRAPAEGFLGGTRSVGLLGDTLVVFTSGFEGWVSPDRGETWGRSQPPVSQAELHTGGGALYALGYDGLARWTGAGWEARTLPVTSGGTLVVDGDTLRFAATWLDDLYLSEDGGRTWALRSAEAVGALVPGAWADSGLLLGTRSSSADLRTSTDGGDTWAVTGTVPADAGPLLMHGGRLYAAVRQDGVRVSDDLGATWTDASGGLPAGYGGWVWDLVAAGGEVVAGTARGGVWRGDGGAWTASGAGLAGGSPQGAHARDGEVLAVFGDERLRVRSDDDWPGVGEPVLQVQLSRVLALDRAALVTGDWGAWRSDDAGATWQQARGLPEFNGTAGPQPLPISGLAARGDTVFAAHPGAWEGSAEGGDRSRVGGGVSRSRDGGRTWSWLLYGMPVVGTNSRGEPYYPAATAVQAWQDLVVLGTADVGVLFSEDRGETWYGGAGLPTGGAVRALTRSDDVLYAAVSPTTAPTAAGVWRSDDLARTWTRASEGLPEGAPVEALAAADGAVLALVTGEHQGLWRLGDGAWSLLAAPADPSLTLAPPLVLHDDLLLLGTWARGFVRFAADEG